MMKRLWKPILTLWIVVATVSGIANAGVPKVGSILPDLTLTKSDGKTVKLSKLGAKVVLLNFWASWCAPCLLELPSIQALRNDFKARGFNVVAVNSDEDPKSALPPVLAKIHLEVPVYIDPSGKLSESFGITALPYTLIVDSKRKVLLLESRERDWNSAEMRSKLESWLK